MLSETKADLNGSMNSIYTPLWLSVSNGYTQICMLLLDFNATPAYVQKMPAIPSHMTSFDTSCTVMSPIRASIIYSRFQIMIHLLEYNASVDEIYDSAPMGSNFEGYLNALKLFYRQFGQSSENLVFLNRLDSFTENPHFYKRMLVDCLKCIVLQVNSNVNMREFDAFLSRTAGTQTALVLDLIDKFQANRLGECQIDTFLRLVEEWLGSMESFLSDTHQMSLINTNSNFTFTELFVYARSLFKRYYAPKSLKELARFKLRRAMFDKLASDKARFSLRFCKIDALNSMLNQLYLPNYFKDYILHRL
jgi:hypothetical protein